MVLEKSARTEVDPQCPHRGYSRRSARSHTKSVAKKHDVNDAKIRKPIDLNDGLDVASESSREFQFTGLRRQLAILFVSVETVRSSEVLCSLSLLPGIEEKRDQCVILSRST